jgi:hypothetical protein
MRSSFSRTSPTYRPTVAVGLVCEHRLVFSVEDRDRVRDHVLRMAEADPRVVAAAVVGGLADGQGDRWSDLDLTFGVDDAASVDDVLEDWTREVAAELRGVHLFDLPAGAAIYRVFLLPGCLQVDLSFAPASAFGARGPRFRLLFGSAVELPQPLSVPADELFGLGVHHALRARFSIERGRWWQAEHWITGVREQAFLLACGRRALEGGHGRRFDDLPAEVREAFEAALVRSLDAEELDRALSCAISLLLRESEDAAELAAAVEEQLQSLASPT